VNTPDERARDIEALTFIFVPAPPQAAGAPGRPARAIRRLAHRASPPVAAGVTLGIVLLASLVHFLRHS
jgi:hypothetical protein